LVAIALIASLAFYLLFDPNDYRDTVTAKVQEQTGRELVIAGDMTVKFFPWLTVQVGETRLGNAPGFGPGPFASVSSARLSVKLWPLLRKEIQIGSVSLDGLDMHLAVAKNGVTNWDDLSADSTAPAAGEKAEPTSVQQLQVAGIELNNATITYSDAQDGSKYTLSSLQMSSGAIVNDQPFSLDAEFDFQISPDDYFGHSRASGKAALDLKNMILIIADLSMSGEASGITPQPTAFEIATSEVRLEIDDERILAEEIKAHLLGITFTAQMEPLSYANDFNPRATLHVERFSLKQLLRTMGVEPPQTADPSALERVDFTADASLGESTLTLSNAVLRIDDTNLKGKLVIPRDDQGSYRFNLVGDSINLDRYMAPASSSSSSGQAANDSIDNIEIPTDMIRSLQAEGSLKFDRAEMSGLIFESIELGLNSKAGKLRLNPISATLFEGTYQGDVQVNASGKTPVLSLNERVEGLQIQALVRSLFKREDITGSMKGNFTLSGAGKNLAEIRRDLTGNIGLQLADGTWQGRDIWYELRAARARLMQLPAPEPRNPPRTEFSALSASGVVTKGVFKNDDLLAELPFLRLTGNGTVDFVTTEMDYSMQARVLQKPEFVSGATEQELNDFTQAVIPLRITGPLASPSIRPDVQAMIKARAKKEVEKKTDELKGRLLDKLIGPKTEPPAEAPPAEAPPEGEQAAPPPPEKLTPEEELKKKLKDLLNP
jgi:AsmA protein